ncbi:efflux RND transporter periplasmic adaptor subunit [Lacunimicrobium album]
MMSLHKSNSLKWFWRISAAGVVIAGIATSGIWWPKTSMWIDQRIAGYRDSSEGEPKEAAKESDSHDRGDHNHEGDSHEHDESSSLEMTSQAKMNLGLTDEFVKPIQLQDFRRTIAVPAIVVARPGRTQIKVSTPLTGVITHVHAITGEAIQPGSLMFEIRLTHEDLVETQTQFLQSLGELDVENREIARLEEVTASGAVPAKTLLERRYAKDKLEALLAAQGEALRLHGFSNRQVDEIVSKRQLLRDLSIVAPALDQPDRNEDKELKLSTTTKPVSHHANPSGETSLVIEQLNVQKGQSVNAGELLCTLADYSILYIEGQAFEQDSAAITQASERGWTVSAVFPNEGGETVLKALKLAFVGNSVDPETRSLPLFVNLPNQVIRDQTSPEGQRFISWKYRPGQRLQLRIPVEEWKEQIVVPVDAIVKDGADWYVFQQNSDHFDRVPVHVKYRDQSSAVIAYDGAIFPGDVIALRSAHQMQMALKNKSGGGADPHAGHNH